MSRKVLRMDHPPDEWGWWQDATGKWHPPGPASQPRTAPAPPAHIFQHAEVIHPKHQRAGAGDYTVKPVRPPSKGLTTTLTVLAAMFGSIVVIGGLALLAFYLFIDSDDDDAAPAPTITSTLSPPECDASKLALQEALLRYKAQYSTDAPSIDALIPAFIPAEPVGWRYSLDGPNVVLTPTDGCA